VTIEELIARLEAADGPSRELDAEIYCFTRYCSLSHWVEDNADPYTSSIDAALSLVPEGLRWRVSGVPAANKALASCATGSIMDPATKEWDAIHTHTAIALCIAALKARAAT
jgi:hypothetical protein